MEKKDTRTSFLSFGNTLRSRLSRRKAISLTTKAGLAAVFLLSCKPLTKRSSFQKRGQAKKSLKNFSQSSQRISKKISLAKGYRYNRLISWGDPLENKIADFKPLKLTGEEQLKRFGYNCDFTAFFPLPKGSKNSSHGLLAVNHEYSYTAMMFPGFKPGRDGMRKVSKDQCKIEKASIGHSIIEIKKKNDLWSYVKSSRYNRRISLEETKIELSGPVRANERVKTKADPEGTTVIGTLANCAGGVTPWNTVLTCEENFDHYFNGDKISAREKVNHARTKVDTKSSYPFFQFDKRFNLSDEQNEANRFGWVVEIDPYDPQSVPKKRTALGRIGRETATTVLSDDGRIAVYSGDDSYFEYFYKFVTDKKLDKENDLNNRDILDSGTLYAARFNASGSLDWLPLRFGVNGLDESKQFFSQADVLIEARRAADIVGATKMDRPEGVTVNPVNGNVYVVMTKNKKRKLDQIDAANPRAKNKQGHIIEIITEGTGSKANHSKLNDRWEMFLIAGDPSDISQKTKYHPDIDRNGYFACPDNCVSDSKGRLWIATDGAEKSLGISEGIWFCETEGKNKALTKKLISAPIGAELTGMSFTPDETTMFISVQHPGERSTFSKPDTRWPDFDEKMPPRPSVIALQKQNNGKIGD